jgi:ATPase family AAA domain-containing protein 3A/B
LDPQLFSEVVDYKVTERHQRLKLASEGMAWSARKPQVSI